jgi:predicted nucleic acid-binding protein
VRLVIDANILVSEAMRERGRAILGHPELELFITEKAISETRHELEKRLVHFQNHRNLPDAIAAVLREEAFKVVETNVTVVPKADHAHLETVAQRRIPRDPDDAPTVALALLLEADIWTLDSDFLGCGVATWITETLNAELQV